MSKLDEGVHEVVMKYMKVQNRPYSVQNVFDNLRGDVPKAKVSLALEVRMYFSPVCHSCRLAWNLVHAW